MPLDTQAFTQQAEWCRKLGSEFTSAVLLALVTVLDDSTQTGRRIINWPGRAGPGADVVPLRMSGALHAMVLTGKAPQLAQLYPPNPMPTPEILGTAIATTLRANDTDILDFLQHAPQTNEVARASLLISGLSLVATETGLPIDIFEIGASGGLNLNLDRFAYHHGDTVFGDTEASVKLSPPWTGPAPATLPTLRNRAGCDLNPINVSDPAQATRLLSYIWPDQPARLVRTRAAIELAQAHPPRLDQADAADWVETLLQSTPEPGHARVLMHSIAWQYMPAPVQARITAAMETAGAAATSDAPLGWLAFELNADAIAQLTLRLWPGDGTPRILADANPHVHAVHWHS